LALAAILLLGLYLTSGAIKWPAPFSPSPRFLIGWIGVVAGMGALVLVGRAWGALIARVLRNPSALTEWEMELALVVGGLLTYSAVTCWIAHVFLHPALILALAVGPLAAGGARPTLHFVSRVVSAARRSPREAAGFAGLILFMAFLAAKPDASLDGLIYQAALPTLYLEHGSYFRFENNIYAGLPNGGNFLFLPGLATGAWPLANAVQPAFLVLVLGFLRCSLGAEHTAGRFWVCALLILSIPSLAMNASVLYVDVILTAVVSVFLLLTIKFLRSKDRALLAWLAFLGFGALSVKWTAAPVLACALVLLAAFLARERIRPSAASVLAVLGLAAFFLAPCLLKNVLLYRSPVFPALFDLFPAPVNWSSDRQILYVRFLKDTFGVGRDVLDFFLLPLNIVSLARPDTILPSGHRPFDGIVGVVPTLTFFALLSSRGGDTAERALRLVVVAGFALWGALSQQIRFLLPILPVAVALALAGLERSRAKEVGAQCSPRRVGGAVVAFSAILGALGVTQALGHVAPHLARWAESRDLADFQYRSLGNEGRLYEWLNDNLAPEERCLFVGMNAYPTLARIAIENDPVFPWYSLERRLDQGDLAGDPFLDLVTARGCDLLVVNEALAFQHGGRWLTTLDSPYKELLSRDFLLMQKIGAYAVFRPRR